MNKLTGRVLAAGLVSVVRTVSAMKRLIRYFLLTLTLLFPLGAFSQSAAQSQTFLLTDYPEFTAQAGDVRTLGLTLRNDGKQPIRVSLEVQGLPQGWKADLLGAGSPVSAAQAAPESQVPLQLRLEIPEDAAVSSRHTFDVVARGDGFTATLPLTVALAEDVPASLELETRLPALRGSPGSSFDFQFTVRNDSGRDILAQLDAQAPAGFEFYFTENYGSQQITSIPIDAGESKDLKLNVRTPDHVEAGEYPIELRVAGEDAQATAEMKVAIVGQPRLRLQGRDGRMSAQATIGETENLPIIVRNEGSAPVTDITLSGSGPSGWKIEFEPSSIASIAPDEEVEVQARITPSDRSLVGDYMTTLRASAQGASTSGEFRITVKSSSLWGIWGIGIIAIAVLILVGAVARFGRR